MISPSVKFKIYSLAFVLSNVLVEHIFPVFVPLP